MNPIAADVSAEFEARLRQQLADKDRDWLTDELVRMILERHNLVDTDARAQVHLGTQAREARLARAGVLALDERGARSFARTDGALTRDDLVANGFIDPTAPAKGGRALTDDDLSVAGIGLREHAKEMLFALLFGDESTNTSLARVQTELLTLALPRAKASALDFMRASTQLAAAGTWQDPDNLANDERADNVLIEVQFGETSSEVVGNAIVAALSLINSLEINEALLYARMINVEESTLIP